MDEVDLNASDQEDRIITSSLKSTIENPQTNALSRMNYLLVLIAMEDL